MAKVEIDTNRNRALLNVVQFLDTDEFDEPQFSVAEVFREAAENLLDIIENDSAELTVMIRDMISARDAAFRALTFEDDVVKSGGE